MKKEKISDAAAKRIQNAGINSVRIWLSYKEFANEGAGYVDALRQYIRMCDNLSYSAGHYLCASHGL